MKPYPNVILHVGPHKTGTTSLQEILSAKQEYFLYAGPKGHLGAEIQDYCYRRISIGDLMSSLEPLLKHAFETEKLLVISNENLSGPLGEIRTRELAGLIEALRQFGLKKITVVAATRPLIKWARSLYREFFIGGDLQSEEEFFSQPSQRVGGVWVGKNGLSRFSHSYVDLTPLVSLAFWCSPQDFTALKIINLSDTSDIATEFQKVIGTTSVNIPALSPPPPRKKMRSYDSMNFGLRYRKWAKGFAEPVAHMIARKAGPESPEALLRKKNFSKVLAPFGFRISGYRDLNHITQEPVLKQIWFCFVRACATRTIKQSDSLHHDGEPYWVL